MGKSHPIDASRALQAAPEMETESLGADLRALRKARGLTLTALGESLNRSVGWLSQVERDISEPNGEDLQAFARALEVPVTMISRRAPARAEEAGFIVRRAARRPIDREIPGLVEELLSPDLTDDFEMVHSTFAPGSGIAEEVQRPTQEVAYIVKGRLEIEIAGRRHRLEQGDSFRIKGQPFRWSNPYAEEAVAIWVIAPPVY